jgi:hypothetical protein
MNLLIHSYPARRNGTLTALPGATHDESRCVTGVHDVEQQGRLQCLRLV